VEISSLLLAAEARSINGRLYVTGGGYAVHEVEDLPEEATLHLGVGVHAEPGEDVSDAVLLAHVEALSGEPVAGEPARTPLRFPHEDEPVAGAPVAGGFALDVSFQAREAGAHRLVVRVRTAGGEVERTLPFAVRARSPEPGPGSEGGDTTRG
jgi:hypothetical protein